MSEYTQRQWDRTVGYGKVPDEYTIKTEDFERENKILRKIIYSLSSDTREQIDKFIKVSIAVDKVRDTDG